MQVNLELAWMKSERDRHLSNKIKTIQERAPATFHLTPDSRKFLRLRKIALKSVANERQRALDRSNLGLANRLCLTNAEKPSNTITVLKSKLKNPYLKQRQEEIKQENGRLGHQLNSKNSTLNAANLLRSYKQVKKYKAQLSRTNYSRRVAQVVTRWSRGERLSSHSTS